MANYCRYPTLITLRYLLFYESLSLKEIMFRTHYKFITHVFGFVYEMSGLSAR